jgi:DNA (cytosine-5)-methyltransferase 1
VWENVPGAFSSNKGLDFRAVLSEISQTQIPMPKDGRWAESGCVEWGGTSSLAWRTLDAQYWGVPQRRKRIFLVADFDGRSAAEILFVEQSLHGDSAESQGTREEIAADVGASIDSASGLNGVYCVGNGQADQTKLSDKVGALNCMHDQQCVAVFREGSYADYEQDNACGTLRAKGGTLSGGSESLLYQKNVGALCMDDYKGANNQYVDQDKCVVNNKTVRRLVPLECERLMGLPDSWTDVEFNGKPAPDSKRYKAIGNGMAVPCSDFIMRRISEVSNEQT